MKKTSIMKSRKGAKRRRTALADVNLSDRFLFAQTMRDPEIIRDVLRVILNNDKISRVVFVEIEKTIENSYGGRGIRIDVFLLDEEETVYYVEMQCQNVDDIPKRSRKYQSDLDTDSMKRGSHFSELAESYVIFICKFDLFGKGRYVYTFRNECVEIPGLYLNDGTTKLFLNCEGSDAEASDELKALLRYIVTSTGEIAEASGSVLVKRLHRRVTKIKEDENMNLAYDIWMDQKKDAWLEGEQKGKREGIQEGIQEGEERNSALMRRLLADGREQDLKRAVEDPAFREKLYEEYQMK